jgi:hypothetical protein
MFTRFAKSGASGNRYVVVRFVGPMLLKLAAPLKRRNPNPHQPKISFNAIAHIVTAMSASSTRQDVGLVKIGRNHFAP